MNSADNYAVPLVACRILMFLAQFHTTAVVDAPLAAAAVADELLAAAAAPIPGPYTPYYFSCLCNTLLSVRATTTIMIVVLHVRHRPNSPYIL